MASSSASARSRLQQHELLISQTRESRRRFSSRDLAKLCTKALLIVVARAFAEIYISRSLSILSCQVCIEKAEGEREMEVSVDCGFLERAEDAHVGSFDHEG